jgi:diguanylate cyclase (GGDEF)-like protein
MRAHPIMASPVLRCLLGIALLTIVAQGQAIQSIGPLLEKRNPTNNNPIVEGSRVTVEGVLTTAPSLLGADALEAWVQDGTGGVGLFSRVSGPLGGDWKRGDLVRATGQLDSYHGKETIILESMDKIGTAQLPEPRVVQVQEVNGKALTGQLVRLSGELWIDKGKYGNRYFLRDHTGSIQLQIPLLASENPEFLERLNAGGKVTLTGIATQKNLDPFHSAGYLLLGRDANDYVFPPHLAWGQFLALSVASLLAATLTYFQVKQRLEKRRRLEMEQLVTELMAAREALEFQARYDSLTGIYNRRAIFEILGKEIERSQRSGAPLALVMADLDYFKKINDELGHLAGDLILREVAQRLRQGLRQYDSIGRYGGEELMLVLPGIAPEDTRRIVELQTAVSGTPLEWDGRAIHVTCSFGVAWLNENALDLEALINLADRMLYLAKRNGRNRIEAVNSAGVPLV